MLLQELETIKYKTTFHIEKEGKKRVAFNWFILSGIRSEKLCTCMQFQVTLLDNLNTEYS